MKISDEITSEISVVPEKSQKEFITWLMDFERSILGNRNPAYKDKLEQKIVSMVSDGASNAEN